MKKIVCTLALAVWAIASQAQTVSLPYATGFDNTSEQKAWTEYRTGFQHTYRWGFTSVSSVSNPYSLYHDYPVEGEATDTLSDWFVSPPIRMTDDAKLKFSAIVYSITGSTIPSDYFGVWFSSTQPDPAKGGYQELLDLTQWASNGFTNWRDTIIDLPNGADSGYIAFRYKATQNWFTINVDDVHVTSATSGLKPTAQPVDKVSLYPNPLPALNELNINTNADLRNGKLQLFDLTGRQVMSLDNLQGSQLKLDCRQLQQGMYTFRIQDTKGYAGTGRFVVD